MRIVSWSLMLTLFACSSWARAQQIEPHPSLVTGTKTLALGEAIQLAFESPKNCAVLVFLREPGGAVVGLLPNPHESDIRLSPNQSRIFPNPRLPYEVTVGRTGLHEVLAFTWTTVDGRLLDPKSEDLRRALEKNWSNNPPNSRIFQDRLPDAYATMTFEVGPAPGIPIDRLPFDSGVLDGPENPHFASGSTRLIDESDYSQLHRWAKLMNSPAHRGQCFLIECHADNRGTPEGNLQLSEGRARAIVSYLAAKCGVARERLTPIGKGDFEPLCQNDSPEDRRRNRRVVLAVDDTSGIRQTLRIP